jgi:Mrp family chromosome partitioning ATPase
MAWVYAQATASDEYQATAFVQVEDPRASILFESGSQLRRDDYVADQVEIFTSGEVARRAVDIAETEDPTWPYDITAVLNRTTVRVGENGSVIGVSFRADRPSWAQTGANAIVAAYRDLLREETDATFQASIEVLDEELVVLRAEVDVLGQEILAATVERSPDRIRLEQQLEAAISRLAELNAQLIVVVDDDRAEAIRAELVDIDNQIATMRQLAALESEIPEIAELEQRRSGLVFQIEELAARRSRIAVDSQLLGSGVVLSTPALTADPSPSGLSRIMIVGVFLGFLVGAGLAYLLALRRRTITSRVLPELVLAAPHIASIPNFGWEVLEDELPVRSSPRSATAEAFRFAASALAQSTLTSGVKSVAFTSPNVSDGKTVVSVNTALAAARSGKHVLLIDADFGSQGSVELLLPGHPPELGITEVVEGSVRLSQAVVPIEGAGTSGLHLLGRGRVETTAPEFFSLPDTHELILAAQTEYDLIVIDTPPMLAVAYASTLAGLADRIVVVVAHESSVTNLEELQDRLALVRTPVLGYVYNLAPLRSESTRVEGSMRDVLGEPVR